MVQICSQELFMPTIDVFFTNVIGNLLVFPNDRVMEITDINITTEGINNLYTYNNEKSVYKISCKPYDFKIQNEVSIFFGHKASGGVN